MNASESERNELAFLVKAGMEPSPLVQQARPEFRPKVATLYEQLFIPDHESELTEGFWRELFLLKPDRSILKSRLDELTADHLLEVQHETQTLFSRAVNHIKSGQGPSDEVSLDTLTVFLAGVLSKRYTSPSSEIITVLAGLDEVDTVFSDFANSIESTIRNGRSLEVRRKAIETSLALVSGAYQTSLVSYFTHRDLFPALMKYVTDAEGAYLSYEPLLLLGLLVNYNKFEYRNPYRTRLEDFVNEAAIQKVVQGLGAGCAKSRNYYTSIIDDMPNTSWSLYNTLSYIGLGMLAPIRAMNPNASADDSREQFTELPGYESAILLAGYDFISANKLFSCNLLSTEPNIKAQERPFSSYLSLISYTLHHAYLSPRASIYGVIGLSTLRIIAEDSSLAKHICSPDSSISVRLCHQRPPLLPTTNTPRPIAFQFLDIAIDAINHNLRRRLDIELYESTLVLMHRVVVYLARNHVRLPLSYHWDALWQALITTARFLQSYASDLSTNPYIYRILTPLFDILALAIITGPSFLPSSTPHDDLFYKLVESTSVLQALKTTYKESSENSAIDIVINTALHFNKLITEQQENGKLGKHYSPFLVSKIIRDGLESLDVGGDEMEGRWMRWEPWRESDQKGLLKKVARCAVEDVKRMVRDL